jgi:hypothetical protein
MDTLKLCRAMETICVQHALSDTRLRDRWLDLMDDWNVRAHHEASRRFQECHTTEPIESVPNSSPIDTRGRKGRQI